MRLPTSIGRRFRVRDPKRDERRILEGHERLTEGLVAAARPLLIDSARASQVALLAEEAAGYCAQGFAAVKLKVGFGLEEDVRVTRALENVRPQLQSHGGDVELLGLDGGVVRLRMRGSCHGCPSSTGSNQRGMPPFNWL